MNAAQPPDPGSRPSGSRPPLDGRRNDPGAPFEAEVRMNPVWCWALITVFLAGITLPGLAREFSTDAVRKDLAVVFRPGATRVAERLRSFEKRVEEGKWTTPIRQAVQTCLYRFLREGNRKVIVGRDGWLFHRPGVQALTGRGPVLGPSFSVAKDPSLKSWLGPVPVIRTFAAQLEERGVGLILVPVPDKASWAAAQLIRPSASAPQSRRHPDWDAFVAALGDQVEVVELKEPTAYLSTDTHWEPSGARAAAFAVARALPSFSERVVEPTAEFVVSGEGDLVGMLGLQEPAASEMARSIRIATVAPVASSTAARIVLLGDSNVNMYDDPSLPFHQTGGGFASWLAAAVGEPIHVIATNGGGATAVRQRFAALPDNVVRAVSVVLWVIAERDLFMDPAVARANAVEWRHVNFNPQNSKPLEQAPPGEPLVVEAVLQAKSRLVEPGSVDYPDNVFTAEFRVDRLVSGDYPHGELMVVLWNFRQRVIQPSARWLPGEKVRLTLVPWLKQGTLTQTNIRDDFDRFDLPLLYAQDFEVISP